MDSILASKAIASLLLPPGGLLTLLILSLLLYRRRQRLATVLLLLALFGGYALSTRLGAGLLMKQVQTYPALRAEDARLQHAFAIVILGGGRRDLAPEYGGETVSAHALERLRYGAWLQRRTALPILVSGGRFSNEPHTEAQLMADVLIEFGASVTWLEDQSRNTKENAQLSSAILLSAMPKRERNLVEQGSEPLGVGPLRSAPGGVIVLVTHAYHMRRSVRVFEQTGLTVVAAPTGFYEAASGDRLRHYLPEAPALATSYRALHELLGMFWYALIDP